MRQARELGVKQPFFVGTNMVDPNLPRRGEGERGRRDRVLADSAVCRARQHADMKAGKPSGARNIRSAPAGRPNIFDILAYTDMYVLRRRH